MNRWINWVEGSALTVLVFLSVALVGRLWLSLPSLAYLPSHAAYTPPPPVAVLVPMPLAIELIAPKAALELPSMPGYRRLWLAWASALPALSGGQPISAALALSAIHQAPAAVAVVWPSQVPFSSKPTVSDLSLIAVTMGNHPVVLWLADGLWHQQPISATVSAEFAARLPQALAAGAPSAAHPLLSAASGSLPAGQVVAAPVAVDQLVPSFLPLPLSVQAIDEGADGVAYTDGATVLHVERSGAFQVSFGSAAPDFFGLSPVNAAESFVSSHPGFTPDLTVSAVTTSGRKSTVSLALTVDRLVVLGATAASVQFAQSSVVAARSAGLGVLVSGVQPFSIPALTLALSPSLSRGLVAVVPVEVNSAGRLAVGAIVVEVSGQEVLVSGGAG
ncbi:MAG: hypothetical protein ACYCOS_07325 [Sulfobacillus sp.]